MTDLFVDAATILVYSRSAALILSTKCTFRGSYFCVLLNDYEFYDIFDLVDVLDALYDLYDDIDEEAALRTLLDLLLAEFERDELDYSIYIASLV